MEIAPRPTILNSTIAVASNNILFVYLNSYPVNTEEPFHSSVFI